MIQYTTEYKDALYHAAKLYNYGYICSVTLNKVAHDIAALTHGISAGEVLDDLDTLLTAWDEYEVLG